MRHDMTTLFFAAPSHLSQPLSLRREGGGPLVLDEATAELRRRHRPLVAVVELGEGDPSGAGLDAHELLPSLPDDEGVPRGSVWPPLVEGKPLDHPRVYHLAEAHSEGMRAMRKFAMHY